MSTWIYSYASSLPPPHCSQRSAIHSHPQRPYSPWWLPSTAPSASTASRPSRSLTALLPVVTTAVVGGWSAMPTCTWSRKAWSTTTSTPSRQSLSPSSQYPRATPPPSSPPPPLKLSSFLVAFVNLEAHISAVTCCHPLPLPPPCPAISLRCLHTISCVDGPLRPMCECSRADMHGSSCLHCSDPQASSSFFCACIPVKHR